MKPLRHLRLWLALGRIAIVVVVVLSLAPMPRTDLDIPSGDKLGHFLVYFALTFWYAQLCASQRELALRALAFALMGACMEVLQSLTGWRTGNDPLDALANVGGAVAGLLLGMTSAHRWLEQAERRYS